MSAPYASYPSLEGRVVFVTGGGSGIGASLVEHFCAQRARVAFVDIAREASEALVGGIKARGLEAPAFIPCDVRDIAALRAAVAEARARLGPIRVLVNNAAHDERHRARVDHDRAADQALAHPRGGAGAAAAPVRKLRPEDVARAVLFFAADDSAACTNQSYVVDGGWV